MAERIRGNEILTGSYGEVWIDGEKVFELSKIEVKVVINREDVQLGLDVDSNMVGLKGEYTIGIKKVFSRWNKYLELIKKGIDVRMDIMTKLKDPNARGGQMERYAIGNCWLNEIPVATYEMGNLIEEEVSGGFTPSDLINLDKIA
ncbi:MAG: phage tail tube protein [Bacillota bacterium]|nr:phage tail tube protein [Bacillota bacterium]